MLLLHNEVTVSFLIGWKLTANFWSQCLWRHLAADYTIPVVMPRALKIIGNHVIYDRSEWLLRVIMISEEAKTSLSFHHEWLDIINFECLIIIFFSFILCTMKENIEHLCSELKNPKYGVYYLCKCYIW